MAKLSKVMVLAGVLSGLTACASKERPPVEMPVMEEKGWSPTLVLNRALYEEEEVSFYEDQSRTKEAYILPAQVLAEDEMRALLGDQKAFAVFMKNPGYLEGKQVAFIFKEGSVKENAIRLSELFDVDNVHWDIQYDYNLNQTKTVVADTKEELLSLLVEPFPIESKMYVKEGVKILSFTRIGEIDKEYRFTVMQGSFKDNFLRLAEKGGWSGDWAFDYDFNIPETYIMRGVSYENILNDLISKYNLPIEKTED